MDCNSAMLQDCKTAGDIAAARAVDREFNYTCGSNLGDGRRGGCAPPHPPAFRGSPPPGPPKKALRALGCSDWSLSRDRATCPGHLRCLGQIFSQKSYFFGRTHLSRAASLPGVELFLKSPTFFEEATCPGQLRCLGQNCFSKIILFWKKPLVPGSFAAWGRTFSRKSTFF